MVLFWIVKDTSTKCREFSEYMTVLNSCLYTTRIQRGPSGVQSIKGNNICTRIKERGIQPDKSNQRQTTMKETRKSSQVTFRTPKTSPPLISPDLGLFFLELMTTSPQCFGTVPSLPCCNCASTCSASSPEVTTGGDSYWLSWGEKEGKAALG